MKKIDSNKTKSKFNNYPLIRPMRIDKLAGVIDLHDQQLCKHAFGAMITALNEEPCVMVTKTTRKYAKAILIHYPDPRHDGLIHKNGPTLHLQLTHYLNMQRQLRFEYNPSDMTEAGEDYLDGLMQEMFTVPFYHLLHHARFTRIHLCRDIEDRHIEDLLIGAKWSKHSLSYVGVQNSYNGKGRLESITFGKGTGNQTIAYDKSLELSGSADGQPLTRIEIHHKCNLTYAELKELPNLFERVQIYSLDCKDVPFDKGGHKNFQDACRLRGVSNAIRNQPVAIRSLLKKALSKKVVPWWGISESEWPKMMLAAIEAARLNNIPDYAEPLSYQFHIGQAA